MAGLGDHITAMLRSHASGDDSTFYSVALQIAAKEAKRGHHVLAGDIKKAVDASREVTRKPHVTSLAQPRGDLAELIITSHPSTRLRDLVLPRALQDQIKHVIAEQRQRKRLLDSGFTPVHRLLLEGPPGTGKTMTASVLAHELSLPMFTVRLDALMSKYMGETASKLRQIFDQVDTRRGVYLFDEFDALGADRAGNDVGDEVSGHATIVGRQAWSVDVKRPYDHCRNRVLMVIGAAQRFTGDFARRITRSWRRQAHSTVMRTSSIFLEVASAIVKRNFPIATSSPFCGISLTVFTMNPPSVL